jgi:hypothetical protein
LIIYLFAGLLASTAVSATAIWPSNLGILLFAMGTPEESVLGSIANYLPEARSFVCSLFHVF